MRRTPLEGSDLGLWSYRNLCTLKGFPYPSAFILPSPNSALPPVDTSIVDSQDFVNEVLSTQPKRHNYGSVGSRYSTQGKKVARTFHDSSLCAAYERVWSPAWPALRSTKPGVDMGIKWARGAQKGILRMRGSHILKDRRPTSGVVVVLNTYAKRKCFSLGTPQTRAIFDSIELLNASLDELQRHRQTGLQWLECFASMAVDTANHLPNPAGVFRRSKAVLAITSSKQSTKLHHISTAHAQTPGCETHDSPYDNEQLPTEIQPSLFDKTG
ncbi:hypothetical protein BDV93DRAFT_511081 [Ceratobasidium sp. AG-I]|nr:hypothetical protein BDV93DRAFT_511081 [Ceratobasidium sp. AG-I]